MDIDWELLLEIQQRDIKYLIFPKDYFYDDNIEYCLLNNPKFDEKVDNYEYILFKI